MITLWLIYATLVTSGIAVAAHALDRLLRLLDRSARMVWGGAVCLALIGPVALSATRSTETSPGAVTAAASPVEAASVSGSSGLALHARSSERPMPSTGVRFAASVPSASVSTRHTLTVPVIPSWIDALVLKLWGGASTLLLLVLAGSAVRTARRRRTWRSTVLDGIAVDVSHDAGPAVLGVVRPRIVVPRWVLAMPAEERRLVLAHECEHVRAGDPMLLAGATIAILCAPWNLGLWYIARRLRLAVEVDCDRRVLRAHADVRRYCNLLLEVGEQTLDHPVLSAALTRRNSDLRHRLEQMTAERSGLSSVSLAACVGLTGASLLLSCSMPRPTGPIPEPSPATRAARTREVPQEPSAPNRDARADSLHPRAPHGESKVARAIALDSLLGLLASEHTSQTAGAAKALAGASDLLADLTRTLAGASDLTRLRDTVDEAALRHMLDAGFDSAAAPLLSQMARLDADTTRIHDAIRHYFPDQLIREHRAPAGLWFLVDAQGAVVRSKRTTEGRAPSINTDVVAREFPGVAAESIDEIRILGGKAVGVPDVWVVWAVLQRGATTK